KVGGFIVNDVHGLDIIPDYKHTYIIAFNANISVGINPTPWIEKANSLERKIKHLDVRGTNAALLLNAACMSPHPAATLVLSVAAVELLAKEENWTTKQRQWIQSLRAHTRDHSELPVPERDEVWRALGRMD